MPKVRARTSPYCSLDCSNKVGKIRGKVSAILNKQIRCGAVKPASSHVCVDCGAAACDYDHRDYLKPLDVVPVCRPCNQKRVPAVDLASAELKYLRGTKKAA